mmetsp:Transcript_9318/g.16784  ORF Transcript_9318/g.16784 Transcript_9318/m.16784 type:complete len:487 (-) Transcript_9318:1284-2744(-)|eukprot:CAMPEP_0182445300 /NCGR_PEP_ID=MMETSP1172-20130603/3471_1 /TAXON_ID=708627 /ORGANISM="Timspurckia oligopyrenoides, Strain CCMP3278" /LENGTH=486 /DNA_ID=CAMNT_0024641045 /DNA_START=100 /DNA_END=1560 /DNA_ORIENTATION=+
MRNTDPFCNSSAFLPNTFSIHLFRNSSKTQFQPKPFCTSIPQSSYHNISPVKLSQNHNIQAETNDESSLNKQSSNSTLHSNVSRRGFLLLCGSLLAFPLSADNAQAISIAPTPINPYSSRKQNRKRRKKGRFMEMLENNPIPDSNSPALLLRGLREQTPLPYHLVAIVAFAASAISTLISHPIDTIKTRLQAHSFTKDPENTENSAVSPTISQQNGVSVSLKRRFMNPVVALNESVRLMKDLYRGVGSNIFKEAPNAAIYIGVYEVLKTGMFERDWFHDYPMIIYLIAGGMGDAVGSLIRFPAELINKRLQLGMSKSAMEAVSDLKMIPLSSLMSSWGAILARDVPFGALQIAFYEQLKTWAATRLGMLHMTEATLWQDCLFGAAAGMLAAILTTPPDVIVTRLSANEQSQQNQPEITQNASIGSVVTSILSEKGILGFYEGAIERGIYYAPLIGIFFALYETGRSIALQQPEILTLWIHSLQTNS